MYPPPFLLALENPWVFEGEIALSTKKLGTATKPSREVEHQIEFFFSNKFNFEPGTKLVRFQCLVYASKCSESS